VDPWDPPLYDDNELSDNFSSYMGDSLVDELSKSMLASPSSYVNFLRCLAVILVILSYKYTSNSWESYCSNNVVNS
jgi:hypothetical protein